MSHFPFPLSNPSFPHAVPHTTSSLPSSIIISSKIASTRNCLHSIRYKMAEEKTDWWTIRLPKELGSHQNYCDFYAWAPAEWNRGRVQYFGTEMPVGRNLDHVLIFFIKPWKFLWKHPSRTIFKHINVKRLHKCNK